MPYLSRKKSKLSRKRRNYNKKSKRKYQKKRNSKKQIGSGMFDFVNSNINLNRIQKYLNFGGTIDEDYTAVSTCDTECSENQLCLQNSTGTSACHNLSDIKKKLKSLKLESPSPVASPSPLAPSKPQSQPDTKTKFLYKQVPWYMCETRDSPHGCNGGKACLVSYNDNNSLTGFCQTEEHQDSQIYRDNMLPQSDDNE